MTGTKEAVVNSAATVHHACEKIVAQNDAREHQMRSMNPFLVQFYILKGLRGTFAYTVHIPRAADWR